MHFRGCMSNEYQGHNVVHAPHGAAAEWEPRVMDDSGRLARLVETSNRVGGRRAKYWRKEVGKGPVLVATSPQAIIQVECYHVLEGHWRVCHPDQSQAYLLKTPAKMTSSVCT